ncbi:MAG: hypothetical protein IKE69_04720 [Thermoguttaceae bacterium]|nr:hypothetical protein [Thermoguttaceae bacterium]
MFPRYIILCIAVIVILVPVIVLALSTKSMFRFFATGKTTDHKTICPKCHKMFYPRTFRCQCGNWIKLEISESHYEKCPRCRRIIPKTFELGRDQYHTLCENCKTDNGINAGKYPLLVVPIIGGTSTGKTSFLSAFIAAFSGNNKNVGPYSLTFPFPGNQKFIAECRAQWSAGRSPEKTRERLPDGVVADFVGHIKRHQGYRMYFYDPAGEYFDKTDKLQNFKYYEGMEGVIFLIDPFSIRKFKNAYDQHQQFHHENNTENFQVSDKDVDDYCDIFINGLLRFHGLTHNERLNSVCAVVITKADAFNLDYLIGEKGIRKYMSQHRHITYDDAMDNVCRRFLNATGAGMVLTKLNENFDEIRCFSISAFGHMPDTGVSYKPQRVEKPILWILERKRDEAQEAYRKRLERNYSSKKDFWGSVKQFLKEN